MDVKTEAPTLVLSRKQEERLPLRVFKFLFAIGVHPDIMEQLELVGYTEDLHMEAWELLHKASGYRFQKLTKPTSKKVRAAVVELDKWDEPHFKRARAALRRRYPSQYLYIFDGLKAQQGPLAIMSVQTFLDRVEALKNGSEEEREDLREQDSAAVALLEQRNIISEPTIAHLRELIKIATSPATKTSEKSADISQKASSSPALNETARKQALIELAIWFEEWSETAKAAISRKSYLIALGLASRKQSASDDDEPSDDDDNTDEDRDDTSNDTNDEPGEVSDEPDDTSDEVKKTTAKQKTKSKG